MAQTPQSSLKKKINEFLASRKHSNNLIEIIASLDDVRNVKPNTLLGIQRLFVELLKKHAMTSGGYTNEDKKTKEAEEKYKSWLRGCYKSVFPKLINVLENGDSDVQLQALSTLMYLVQGEAKYPVSPKILFPEDKLQMIIESVISNPFFSVFVQRLKEYFTFKDVIFYSFKCVSNILSENFNCNEEHLMNVLNFVKEIPVPNNREKLFLAEAKSEDFISGNEKTVLDIKDFCSFSSKIWAMLSGFKNHTTDSTKLLLIVLIDKLMFYHSNPIIITDFLMNALSLKGPIAVLALQGMVNLVRQYNLEYPNIYDKLYDLLEPNIFYTKYKARLFYLTDLLMMSTHLPEALVASFIKRLCRLSLTAPPQDIAIMIYLIGNLILRHKGLTILFQNNDTATLNTDPFDNDEKDPYETNALKSSLWEIKMLQNHPLYSVNVPARFINNPLPNVEWDLGKYLEVTYDELFTREFKKKQKNISTNFEQPTSMFQPSNAKLFDHFVLV
uniref:Nucleolar complex protein 4 homolog n=1 Tax=Cacopsylla melanoneura TaxID=428564 RepID=A0A8D8Q3G2_9HEMI